MEAAIKACETVDACTKDVVEAAKEGGFNVLVIADHGNCDTMINPDGSPNTAHTTNPVPIILVSDQHKSIKNGNLGDIAPTILELMGVEKPSEMTSTLYFNDMKNIRLFLLATVIFTACTTPFESFGEFSRKQLQNSEHNSWFMDNYDAHPLNNTLVSQIDSLFSEIEVTIYMGTWCEDSQRSTWFF